LLTFTLPDQFHQKAALIQISTAMQTWWRSVEQIPSQRSTKFSI